MKSVNTVVLLPCLALVLLTSCGPKDRGQEAQKSNEEAIAALEARVKKTSEVKSSLEPLLRIVRPAEHAVNDIGRYLNADLKLDKVPYSRLSDVFRALREVIQATTKGMVENRPDGSWYLERNLSSRECRNAKVEMVGRRVDDHDQLLIHTTGISDCNSVKKVLFAEAKLYSKGVLNLTFHPENLPKPPKKDPKLEENFKFGNCFISVRENSSALQCQPGEIHSGKYMLVLEHLDIETGTTDSKIIGSGRAVVYDDQPEALATADAEITDKKIRVDVKPRKSN